MNATLHYLATNLWWPFVGGVLLVAAAIAVKTAATKAARWARGRRT